MNEHELLRNTDKFSWNEGDFTITAPEDVQKSKLHVIHYSSNEDLPLSISSKLPDAVALTVFRHALNGYLNEGKSEMNSYARAYKALQDAGYAYDSDQKLWKTGGPDGVNLPAAIQKDNPTSQQTHVPRPLGSDEEKDDPGTQDVDPPQAAVIGDDIQDPNNPRNKKKRSENKDDPGTQDVDPPDQAEVGAPNFEAIIPRQGKVDVSKRISGSSNIGLNQKGIDLAEVMGQKIHEKGGLDVLYFSPLARAVETAHEILEHNPYCVAAKPNSSLQPWHLGEFEGKEPHDVRDQIDGYITHPDEIPPGKGNDSQPAESFNSAKRRQLDFFSARYKDFEEDPTLKIGIITHSRGQELLQAWVDDGCPSDYELDDKDVIHPDDLPHVTMARWHKDEINIIDVDDPDPLKPGVYLILHSLTDDDSDEGNEELQKRGRREAIQPTKFLPPLEVHKAAKLAYDAGTVVLDITSPLAEGEGLTEVQIREIQKHFDDVSSVTESEISRNAWGGYHASKWAQRVLKKIEKDFPGWIGVDLDGTIAQPLESFDPLKIGDPIQGKFLDRVKQAIKDGKAIRIFTARVAHDPEGRIRKVIEAWCLKNLGKVLPVTNEKDPGMTELWDDRGHHPDEINKAGSGVMIALMLDPSIANQLKVDGGEKPEDMHVTLLYLGKQAAVPMDKLGKLEKALETFAQSYAPLQGEIAGPIRFAACKNTEGRDVAVASFDTPSIQDFRKALKKVVESVGFEIQ